MGNMGKKAIIIVQNFPSWSGIPLCHMAGENE